MTFFVLSPTLRVAGRRIPRRWPPPQVLFQLRHYNKIGKVINAKETTPFSYIRKDTKTSETFADLGVTPRICEGLREAYPNVTKPTALQTQFIPAVLSGKDVLLKDFTGSGKTFGLVLALLSKPRRHARSRTYAQEKIPLVSSLLITPHRDLAFQILHWIKTMHESGRHSENLASIAQVLVRGGSPNYFDENLDKLRRTPPGLVVGTPQAVLEVIKEDPTLVGLGKGGMTRGLETLVIDEADYLIEIMPKNGDKYDRLKYERMVKKHPSPTRQILDFVYAPNREYRIAHGRRDSQDFEANEGKPWREGTLRGAPQKEFGSKRPQLVLSSATMRAYFRKCLIAEKTWLRKEEDVIKISGQPDIKPTKEVEARHTLGGTSMVHCGLVVNEAGEIKNFRSAIVADTTDVEASKTEDTENEDVGNEDQVIVDSDVKPDSEGEGEVTDVGNFMASGGGVDNDHAIVDISEKDEEEFGKQPSPFSLNVLEAVAATFALDVPQVALMVLATEAPVRRAVYDLRKLGVNAYPLDLLESDKGGAYLLQKGSHVVSDNPTLLVSTLASTRGMDLPDLSHVFMLGVPEDRSADTYLHVAGRVGRFGRGGKVVAIMEADKRRTTKKGKSGRTNEVSWYGNMYRTIGVKPTRLGHFD